MRNTFFTIGVAASILSLSACTKQPLKNLTDDESRIYITNHNDSVSFTSFKTFSITDSVAVIDNNHLRGREVTDVDSAYINAVKQQMIAKGYTLVANNQTPDLGVAVNRVYNTYTGVVDYSGYGGDYYDYWDPYYWGYPGYGYYFPAYGVYQVSEGALEVDILDLKDASADKQIKDIWSGLIRGAGVFDVANAQTGVQALFDQSSYLKAGQ